jgi:hypothetical protein
LVAKARDELFGCDKTGMIFCRPSRRENASGRRIIEAKLLLSGIVPEYFNLEDCGALSTKSPARHRRKLLLPA